MYQDLIKQNIREAFKYKLREKQWRSETKADKAVEINTTKWKQEPILHTDIH